ncbi:MAG: hypothetical protein CM1200mP2_54900 [Planctomycetaceae bacterium]|nr:MAG: hypothetical protein CM1200mP2_54900 [Planctomycetaceae bacterium]
MSHLYLRYHTLAYNCEAALTLRWLPGRGGFLR